LEVSGFEISEMRHCTARLLPDGITARITFESGFRDCAGFRFSTQGSDPISRSIGVLVSNPSTVANASALPIPSRDRMHN
jgi:hypothetical protein